MESSEDRLRAFCSVTFDYSFVVRDLKIIEGTHGPFVAMPSRKLTHRCNRCGMKNYIRSNYCNSCGTRLKDQQRHSRGDETPNKLYADVAHPVNQECRDMIQKRVVEEYFEELERAKQPGYSSRYDDSYEAPHGRSEPGSSQPASEKSESGGGVQQRIDAGSDSSPAAPHTSRDVTRERASNDPRHDSRE
ncbi:MAG: SpoVG family protein [Aureliella sp.]